MAEQVPSSRRLHRPSWRDPRLGIGVVLIAASVALGSWAVSSASRSVDVYVAARPLAPGHELTVDDVEIAAARPGDTSARYLLADEGLSPGSVLVRPVGQGELVPRTAVGRREDLDVRPLVIPVGAASARGLEPGHTVDVWLTDPERIGAGQEARAEPRLLAEDLVVAEVTVGDSVLAGAVSADVEVLVPRAEIATLIDATSGPREIVIVPVPGGRG